MRLLSVATVVVPSLAKTTDSQVMLQVANLKRGAAIQSMHNGVHAMETRMEAMLSEVVASGEEPQQKLTQEAYEVMLEALTTIESQLDAEKVQNVQDWTEADNKVLQCGITLKNQYDTLTKPLLEASDESAETHETCRDVEDTTNVEETTKHTAMIEAGEHRDTLAGNAADDKPATVCDLEKIDTTDTAAVALDKANRAKEALADAAAWATQHKQGLADAIAAYTTAKNNFDEAKTASDDKAEECDDAQWNFEKNFCLFDQSVATICSSRTSCVTREEANRDTKRTELEAKVSAEKLILKSCSKVRCYLSLIKGDVSAVGDLTKPYTITQEMYNECLNGDGTYDGSEWHQSGPDSPDKLNIDYPESTAADCDTKFEGDTKSYNEQVAVTPDLKTDWYSTHYQALVKGSDWMQGRVAMRNIQQCHGHLNSEADQ